MTVPTRHALLWAVILTVATAPAGAQDDLTVMLPGLKDLPGLAETIPEARATAEIFGKQGFYVTPGDVMGVLDGHPPAIALGPSTVLVPDGTDPFVIQAAPGGGYEAYWWCRLVPVCAIRQP